MSLGAPYPLFGSTIECPHCQASIPALILTDSYLCPRHGVFEADPVSHDLVHLQSSRRWRQWQSQWFRQHTHADGIRFEIHEELDHLRVRGLRATQVVIAQRYKELLRPYLVDQGPFRRHRDQSQPRLYGLPVFFSADGDRPKRLEASNEDLPADRWTVINFEILREQEDAALPYSLLPRFAT